MDYTDFADFNLFQSKKIREISVIRPIRDSDYLLTNTQATKSNLSA